jgi:hypothetical protein
LEKNKGSKFSGRKKTQNIRTQRDPREHHTFVCSYDEGIETGKVKLPLLYGKLHEMWTALFPMLSAGPNLTRQ